MASVLMMIVADHLLHLTFERVERVGALVMVSTAHLAVFGDALGRALGRRWVLMVMVDFGLVCC